MKIANGKDFWAGLMFVAFGLAFMFVARNYAMGNAVRMGPAYFPTVLAVLDRENLARIIVEQPMLGAKILMELVLMLSQRLRSTGTRLLEVLDERSGAAQSPVWPA